MNAPTGTRSGLKPPPPSPQRYCLSIIRSCNPSPLLKLPLPAEEENFFFGDAEPSSCTMYGETCPSFECKSQHQPASVSPLSPPPPSPLSRQSGNMGGGKEIVISGFFRLSRLHFRQYFTPSCGGCMARRETARQFLSPTIACMLTCEHWWRVLPLPCPALPTHTQNPNSQRGSRRRRRRN